MYALPLTTLAEVAQQENVRFFQHVNSDSVYDSEIFRRAIVQENQRAWLPVPNDPAFVDSPYKFPGVFSYLLKRVWLQIRRQKIEEPFVVFHCQACKKQYHASSLS